MRYFDPHSLEIFIAVCEEQSIALAADRVALVPSAISKRIAAMEEQAGVQLLQRSKRGVTPTPAGEVLLRSARETLASMERMHAELGEFTHGIQGNIKILASMSVIYQFLPEEIASFSREHGRVKVSIDEKVSSLIVRGIEEGRADIGICWEEANTRGLYCKPYLDDHLAIVFSSAHGLDKKDKVYFEDTLDYDHVDIIPGSIVNLTLQRQAAAVGKTLRSRVQVTTFDAACRIVAAGLAVAVVPLRVARLHEKLLDIHVTPLEDSWAKRQFVICARDYAQLSAPARLLFDHLSSEAS